MGKLIKEAYLDTDEDDNLVIVFTPAGMKRFNLKPGAMVDVDVIDGVLHITPIKEKAKKARK
jgi:Asp/Glu/hydantoin racemase